jgi:hypothetical protein
MRIAPAAMPLLALRRATRTKNLKPTLQRNDIVSRYIPSTTEQKRTTATLQRLQERTDLIRSELQRLGDAEFTRRYQTGPVKPAHLAKF